MSAMNLPIKKIWGIAAITALYRDMADIRVKTGCSKEMNHQVDLVYPGIMEIHLQIGAWIEENLIKNSYSFDSLLKKNNAVALYKRNDIILESLAFSRSLKIKSDNGTWSLSRWRAEAHHSLSIATARKRSVLTILENITQILPESNPTYNAALKMIDLLNGPASYSRIFSMQHKKVTPAQPK